VASAGNFGSAATTARAMRYTREMVACHGMVRDIDEGPSTSGQLDGKTQEPVVFGRSDLLVNGRSVSGRLAPTSSHNLAESQLALWRSRTGCDA